MEVKDITATPTNLYDKITRLATRYCFMTLARSKQRTDNGFRQWVTMLAGIYKDSSVWLLSMFNNPDVDWYSMLIHSRYDNRTPVQEVRTGTVEVLSETMKNLYPKEAHTFLKAAAKLKGKNKRTRSPTPS